jgi:peptide-methionine (R)-S-oxide reductase
MSFFMNRRSFIVSMLGGAVVVAASGSFGKAGCAMSLFDKKKDNAPRGDFPFTLSDSEWRERLSPDAYRVLRGHGTERAFSSPLNDEKRAGVFHCAGCDQPLYDGSTKFNSGTGWPSFWAPVDAAAIGTSTDYKIGVPRTECHCNHCGGHLGHIFDDGPPPTGKRHCLNGVCLTFKPA